MLHTLPLTADPDVEQAIEDFSGPVAELRAVSASLIDLPPVSPKYAAAVARCAEITGDVTTRAERIGVTADTLLALINARLADRARPNTTPLYAARRALVDEVAAAEEAKKDADRVLRLAQRKANAAAARLHGAERALAMFSERAPSRSRQMADA